MVKWKHFEKPPKTKKTQEKISCLQSTPITKGDKLKPQPTRKKVSILSKYKKDLINQK